MMNKKKLELYVHIPFCVRKCAYCDFLSFPGSVQAEEAYAEQLIKEIRCQGACFQEYEVVTVFIGGGTPSILEERWIAAVMDAVYETFSVREGAEITIEANPGTVTVEKLAVYRQSGINRVSLGLQSADDVELRRLGRIHTYADFLKSYQRVRMAGFTNINVDLMSALPGQTLESWKTTLKKVAMLKPEHISAYSLIVEEGTPYYARFGEPGEIGVDRTDGEVGGEVGRSAGESGSAGVFEKDRSIGGSLAVGADKTVGVPLVAGTDKTVGVPLVAVADLSVGGPLVAVADESVGVPPAAGGDESVGSPPAAAAGKSVGAPAAVADKSVGGPPAAAADESVGAPAAVADKSVGVPPAAGADKSVGGAPAAGADKNVGGPLAAGTDKSVGGPLVAGANKSVGGAPAAGADQCVGGPLVAGADQFEGGPLAAGADESVCGSSCAKSYVFGDRSSGGGLDDLAGGSPAIAAGYEGPAGCGCEVQPGLLDLPDLPDEDTEREMYELTQSFLGGLGYERYEISNYAKPGYECRHNVGYWTGVEYLGVGLGASSYVGGCRFHNEACLETYMKADFNVSPDFEEMLRQEPDMLTIQEKMEEFMFLGLRLTKGVSHQEFAARFGQNLQEVYGKIIQKLRAEGLLELSGDYLRLTKRGVDISNYVMSQFLFDR